jgi:hypothetical protein
LFALYHFAEHIFYCLRFTFILKDDTCMQTPRLDPAPITRYLRAKASSHLLVAAVDHFNVFEELAKAPLSMHELQQKLHLKERPAMVLFPALCAMNMIECNGGKYELTDLGRFLTAAQPANLICYVGLEKEDAGVLQMVEWLRNDGPLDAQHGLSYVKDEDAPSPMDEPEAARYFTLALAGRAKYLSPVVAAKITKHEGVLLDIAAGTGYYAYEWLMRNPSTRAVVFDRPEVLKVAEELLNEFCEGNNRQGVDTIKSRVTFLPGDMLTDDLPNADVVLAASLFHDWPTETCEFLARKFAKAVKAGGSLWIHDAFLNDDFDGPIAVTDYSAMLFLGTKGRCYSRSEYKKWLADAGLIPSDENIPTLLDYGLISARKPG